MTEAAIEVTGLSKQYHIGAAQQRSDSLRDWLTSRVRRGRHDARDETIWALKDVSFEVKPGEVVGVIGRNGAGKSTLLKILSRITEPTAGSVRLNGRVGSLLEVGTGFHPELTGRDNVYLSGAILGMTRREIEGKFDEIVAFSGVEQFIDTPIKRYSSGMNVRLGFAVAAHLEPEILLVDEVLAVGDAEFQSRCLGKMGEVARGGRTILFVSHNLGAIQRLCSRTLLIDGGSVAWNGDTGEAVSRYMGTKREVRSGFLDVENFEPRTGSGIGARITAIGLLNSSGEAAWSISALEGFTISVQVRYSIAAIRPEIGFLVTSSTGQRVYRTISLLDGMEESVGVGEYRYNIRFQGLPLAAGVFAITPWVRAFEGTPVDDQLDYAFSFEVVDHVSWQGTTYANGTSPGEMILAGDWSIYPSGKPRLD